MPFTTLANVPFDNMCKCTFVEIVQLGNSQIYNCDIWVCFLHIFIYLLAYTNQPRKRDRQRVSQTVLLLYLYTLLKDQDPEQEWRAQLHNVGMLRSEQSHGMPENNTYSISSAYLMTGPNLTI